MPLTRKQVYLDVASQRKIRTLSRKTGLSEAEHIRRAIASYVSAMPQKKAAHPLLEMVGIGKNETAPRDGAIHHDRYLYGKTQ